MYSQPYSVYQDTNVKTASQGKLVVLLYEGAARRLAEASNMFSKDGKIDASHVEKFGIAVLKAQEIITELQVSLDMESGGDIAKNLMSLYVYFNNELTAANISKSKKKIDFVLDMINQLLVSWRAVANSTANAPAAEIRSTLDIEG